MTANGLLLSPMDLGIAALLICVAAGVSMILSMGIHKTLLVAAIRLIVQLLLVGYLLKFVFSHSSAYIIAIVMVVMISAASYEIGARQDNRKVRRYGINLVVLTSSTVGVGSLGLISLMGAGGHIFDAQHIIPIFGIILGAAMNSTALTLNTYARQVAQRYQVIETRLALGDNFHKATQDIARSAAVSGTIPLINQMAGAGIITLPGIMSGQLLVGQSPVQAAFYQIFLMSLLALVSVVCVAMSLWFFTRYISDQRQRLRLERILDV